MKRLLTILALSVFSSAMNGHADPSNPAILSGLGVRAEGNEVVVDPGTCRLGGKTVEITSTTRLAVAPASLAMSVDNEPYNLSSDAPDRWAKGTHLRGTLAGGTGLPGSLVPGSLTVKLADGTVLEKDKDYLLDEKWAALGRMDGGRVSTSTTVLISYQVSTLRVDAIQVTPDGRVSLVTGAPRKSAPPVPKVTSGALCLANVFIPYSATSVAPWQIFEVEGPFGEPDARESARRAAFVPKTLEKLRKGQPVSYVAWGDSVTVGGDASSPEKGYARLFATRLGERFPSAQIHFVNAGIGATNTNHRLPGFEKDVLAHKPDLVTIEFVNDMGFPEEMEKANFKQAIDKLHAAGAEVIIITPHFTMPEMMGLPDARGKETRKTVEVLRQIADFHKVGLADVSRRWEHLAKEGLSYMVYLENGINHPDDRGHELFVKELLTFFPEK